MSEKNIVVIDGAGIPMGRLASYAAKEALFGKEIVIVNANDVLIVGNKKDIYNKYYERVKRGGYGLKGQRIIRTPERILKRTVRGMFSHKQTRGKEAFDRIKSYNQVPEQFKGAEKISLEKSKSRRAVTLKELATMLK